VYLTSQLGHAEERVCSFSGARPYASAEVKSVATRNRKAHAHDTMARFAAHTVQLSYPRNRADRSVVVGNK
jgi:hypothetical protein